VRERKHEARDYLENLLIMRDQESKFQDLDDFLTAEYDKARAEHIDDLDDSLNTRENKPVKHHKNEPDNFFSDWIERYM